MQKLKVLFTRKSRMKNGHLTTFCPQVKSFLFQERKVENICTYIQLIKGGASSFISIEADEIHHEVVLLGEQADFPKHTMHLFGV